MPRYGRQLELLPLRGRTADQRKAWIRDRLRGFSYRQAERESRRRLARERRLARQADDDRQITLESLLEAPPVG